MAQGYRKISNKHRIVARIDREDWVHVLAKSMRRAVADFYEPNGQVSSHWADHYRRCHSSDKLTLGDAFFKLMRGSSGDSTGFCPKITQDKEAQMPTCKTSVTVTEEKVITLSEEDVIKAVKQYVKQPTGEVDFDISSQGGYIREVTVKVTRRYNQVDT